MIKIMITDIQVVLNKTQCVRAMHIKKRSNLIAVVNARRVP